MKKRFESSIGWFGRRVEGIMSWRFLVIIQVDSLCSVISMKEKRFSLVFLEGRGFLGGWKTLATKLRSIGVAMLHKPVKALQEIDYQMEWVGTISPKGASYVKVVRKGQGEVGDAIWIHFGMEILWTGWARFEEGGVFVALLFWRHLEVVVVYVPCTLGCFASVFCF